MESYSDFHDTKMDVNVCFDKLYDLIHEKEPITLLDLIHLKPFIKACREVVELYEEGVKWNIIDENGHLKQGTEDDE